MAVASGENKTACYQDTRTLCDQFTSLRSCKSSINAAGFLTALCAGADPLGTTGWGCSSNCARVLVQCAPTIMQGNNDGESNTCAPSRPLGLVYAFGPAWSVRRGVQWWRAPTNRFDLALAGTPKPSVQWWSRWTTPVGKMPQTE